MRKFLAIQSMSIKSLQIRKRIATFLFQQDCSALSAQTMLPFAHLGIKCNDTQD